MDENRKKARAVAKSTTAASFRLERECGNDMAVGCTKDPECEIPPMPPLPPWSAVMNMRCDCGWSVGNNNPPNIEFVLQAIERHLRRDPLHQDRPT